jgi:hypothetical protein
MIAQAISELTEKRAETSRDLKAVCSLRVSASRDSYSWFRAFPIWPAVVGEHTISLPRFLSRRRFLPKTLFYLWNVSPGFITVPLE